MLTRFVIWLLVLLGLDPRGLFRFWDGRRWRSVDPIETLRAFFTLNSFDWDETPNLLRADTSTVQLEALRAIALAVRTVFKIPDVSAGGLTELECLDLLKKFRVYIGDVKKNGSLIPISPEPTESDHLDGLPIPRKPRSASGSTQTEPSPEQPGSPVAATSEG